MADWNPLASNLYDHAVREMEIAQISEEERPGILRVISEFARIGSSGSQAAWLIVVIKTLLTFKPLSGLTDDPKEWMQVAEDMWQSRRDSEAFSTDRGDTYYLLSEGGSAKNPWPRHKTFRHVDG